MLLRRGPLACHPCPDRRWCRFLSIHRTFDAVDRLAGWRASNWGANQRWGDLPVAEPASIEELQELVCKSGKVRCIGSAHSFTPLIGNGAAESSAMQLISLRGMPRTAVIDEEQRTVTVDAGTTYSELCCFLASHSSELALPTTASLPHFSVAGAVATGTHGSSGMGSDGRLKLAGLADAVTALEIIGADGSVRTLTKEASKDFDCAVVSLGMLGVVTKLQLQLVPAYDVRQRVYGGWPPVAHQNEATGAGGLKRMLASYSEALQQTDSLSAFVMWDVDDPGMLICRDKLHRSSGEPLTAPPTAPTQWKDTGALLRHEPIEGFLEGFGAFDATSTGRWCDKMHSALAKHCRSPRPVASPCACLCPCPCPCPCACACASSCAFACADARPIQMPRWRMHAYPSCLSLDARRCSIWAPRSARATAGALRATAPCGRSTRAHSPGREGVGQRPSICRDSSRAR